MNMYRAGSIIYNEEADEIDEIKAMHQHMATHRKRLIIYLAVAVRWMIYCGGYRAKSHFQKQMKMIGALLDL